MVADLAPAEVHLVVTAREPLGLFTASWQESVKNRDTTPDGRLRPHRVDGEHRACGTGAPSTSAGCSSGGRRAFPPERVHVLPLPGTDAPRREIWDRFAGLLGVDPDSVRPDPELPERVHGRGRGRDAAPDQPRTSATSTPPSTAAPTSARFLADERLVPRNGDPFWPAEERVEEIRTRGDAAVDYIAAQGFDVIGDLDALLRAGRAAAAPGAGVGHRRRGGRGRRRSWPPRCSHDVRDLRHQRRALREELARRSPEPSCGTGLRGAVVRRYPWLRPVLQRRMARPSDVRLVMLGPRGPRCPSG